MKRIIFSIIPIFLSGLCFSQTDLQLNYSSFLGGTESESVFQIKCNSEDEYIICGTTNSDNFPITGDAFQSNFNGFNAGYFAVLSESGDLIYSTFLAGTEGMSLNSVDVNSENKIVIAGKTEASDFPLLNAVNSTFQGEAMGYLTCFDENFNLSWSTFLGGEGSDNIFDLEIDGNDNIFITGVSSSTGLGTAGVHQEEPLTPDNTNSFIGKLNPTGEIIWFSYISGSGITIVHDLDISVDDSVVYVTGVSLIADDHGFINGHQPIPGGGSGGDCFLAAYSTADGTLEWGTYYGGAGSETRGYVEVMDDGTVILTGGTSSDENIASEGAFQTERNGSSDHFIAAFEPDGTRIWATYYGGNSSELFQGDLAVIGNSIYTVGTTNSNNGVSVGNPILDEIPDSDDSSNSYMVRFDNNGVPVWSTFTNQNYECALTTRMVVNDNHEIYAAGNFNPLSTDQACLDHISSSAYQPFYGGGDSDIGIFHFQDNVLSTSFYKVEPLQIYPNPATQDITIQAPHLLWAGMELSVTDISGRVVDQVARFQSGSTYNTAQLSNGVYVVTGRIGERVFREKVVVHR